MKKAISKCATCKFPLSIEREGQVTTCPMCGSINEARITGVEIPTPIFAGAIGFLLGVFIGPAIIASTTEGSRWLAEKAREKVGGR